jgi:hypothetical protein
MVEIIQWFHFIKINLLYLNKPFKIFIQKSKNCYNKTVIWNLTIINQLLKCVVDIRIKFLNFKIRYLFYKEK